MNTPCKVFIDVTETALWEETIEECETHEVMTNAMDQVNVGSTKEGNKLISGRHRTPIFIIRNDPSA